MVMIAQRRIMVDPTFPCHSQIGKYLYSAQRDKSEIWWQSMWRWIKSLPHKLS